MFNRFKSIGNVFSGQFIHQSKLPFSAKPNLIFNIEKYKNPSLNPLKSHFVTNFNNSFNRHYSTPNLDPRINNAWLELKKQISENSEDFKFEDILEKVGFNKNDGESIANLYNSRCPFPDGEDVENKIYRNNTLLHKLLEIGDYKAAELGIIKADATLTNVIGMSVNDYALLYHRRALNQDIGKDDVVDILKNSNKKLFIERFWSPEELEKIYSEAIVFTNLEALRDKLPKEIKDLPNFTSKKKEKFTYLSFVPLDKYGFNLTDYTFAANKENYRQLEKEEKIILSSNRSRADLESLQKIVIRKGSLIDRFLPQKFVADIFEAVYYGNLDKFKEIISEEKDKNERDSQKDEGYTNDYKYSLSTILQFRDKKGFNLLHYATANNQLSVVKWLIDKGININASDINGINCMHLAVMNDCDKSIISLLCQKAYQQVQAMHEPFSNNQYGHNPIFVGVTYASLMSIKKLFEMGYDLHQIDSQGYSLIMMAIKWHGSPEYLKIIQWLYKKGVNINLENDNDTALTIAYSHGLKDAINWLEKNGSLKNEMFSFEYFSDVAEYDKRELTWASQGENNVGHRLLSFVENRNPKWKLIAKTKHTEINAIKSTKNSFISHDLCPILSEYLNKLPEKSEELKNRKDEIFTNVIAIIENRNHQNISILNTPILIKAIKAGDKNKCDDILKKFLEMDELINAVKAGDEGKYLKLREQIKGSFLKVDELITALKAEDKSKYSELLKQIKDPLLEVDEDGNSAIHHAAFRKQDYILKTLLAHLEMTGNPKLIEMIHQKNNDGETPLHLAAKHNNFYIIEALHSYGAYLECEDNWGNTPLHTAVYHHNERTIISLIKLGANPEKPRWIDNHTPFSLTELSVLAKCKQYFSHAKNNELQFADVFSYFNVINTLIFQGGSSKGIAYYGALHNLEDKGLNLKNIKKVGGASAGSIASLIVGLGYPVGEIDKSLEELLETEEKENPNIMPDILKYLNYHKETLTLAKIIQITDARYWFVNKTLNRLNKYYEELLEYYKKLSEPSPEKTKKDSLFGKMRSFLLNKTLSYLDLDFSFISDTDISKVEKVTKILTKLNEIIEDFNNSKFQRLKYTGILALTTFFKANPYLVKIKELLDLVKIKELLEEVEKGTFLGINDGERIREVFDTLIFIKTGIKNATFEDLKYFKGKNSDYNVENSAIKEMRFVALNIKTSSAEILSYETTPKMIVADAVRCSISIPSIFKPHPYYVKNDDGKRLAIYEDEKLYIDGGTTNNYPMWLFDIQYSSLGEKVHLCQDDRNTILGLRLISSIKKKVLVDGKKNFKLENFKKTGPTYNISNLIDLYSSVMSSFLLKEDSDHDLRSDIHRTVHIDTGKINFLKIVLSKEEKDLLIVKGNEGIEDYIALTKIRQKIKTPESQLFSILTSDLFIDPPKEKTSTESACDYRIIGIDLSAESKITDISKIRMYNDCAYLIYKFFADESPAQKKFKISADPNKSFILDLKVRLNFYRTVIAKHISINSSCFSSGNTALHYSIQNNSSIVNIQHLIDEGACLEVTNKKHLSPLDLALIQKNYFAAIFLIEKNAKTCKNPKLLSNITSDCLRSYWDKYKSQTKDFEVFKKEFSQNCEDIEKIHKQNDRNGCKQQVQNNCIQAKWSRVKDTEGNRQYSTNAHDPASLILNTEKNPKKQFQPTIYKQGAFFKKASTTVDRPNNNALIPSSLSKRVF